MLDILFDKKLKNGNFIVNELNSHVRFVHKMQFDKAVQSIEACSKKVDEEIALATDSAIGNRRNQLFILSVYVKMLQEYLDFWGKIFKAEYPESWSSIQNILDLLRVLKKFNRDHETFNLKFIEEQVTGFEKLYPYKIFASTEMILKDVECSICGKDFYSLECDHLGGELYDGQMARGIVNKIDSVSAVALVENPKDKRCVMMLENTEANFRLVAYLPKVIKELKISPWNIEGVRQTRRKKEIGEFEIERHDMCPCGSEKSFGECCELVGYVELPHMDVIINKKQSLEIKQD